MTPVPIPEDGAVRYCVWCEKPKANTFCTNPERRKVNRQFLCRDCYRKLLRGIGEDYKRQVVAGVPKGMRGVLIPMKPGANIYGFPMDKDLVAILEKIDREFSPATPPATGKLLTMGK